MARITVTLGKACGQNHLTGESVPVIDLATAESQTIDTAGVSVATEIVAPPIAPIAKVTVSGNSVFVAVGDEDVAAVAGEGDRILAGGVAWYTLLPGQYLAFIDDPEDASE